MVPIYPFSTTPQRMSPPKQSLSLYKSYQLNKVSCYITMLVSPPTLAHQHPIHVQLIQLISYKLPPWNMMYDHPLVAWVRELWCCCVAVGESGEWQGLSFPPCLLSVKLYLIFSSVWLHSTRAICSSSIIGSWQKLRCPFRLLCWCVLCLCHFDYDGGGSANEQAAHNYKHLIIAVLGWCFILQRPHAIHLNERIASIDSSCDCFIQNQPCPYTNSVATVSLASSHCDYL